MRKNIIEIIRSLLIVLFVYTATNKLLTQEIFAKGLSRLPFFKSYSSTIAIAVPIAEFLIASLLIIPKTIRYGFWFSLSLMIVFTIYLSYSVLGDFKLPCSCGGIISKMSWIKHLYFNIGTIVLIIYALFLGRNKNIVR